MFLYMLLGSVSNIAKPLCMDSWKDNDKITLAPFPKDLIYRQERIFIWYVVSGVRLSTSLDTMKLKKNYWFLKLLIFPMGKLVIKLRLALEKWDLSSLFQSYWCEIVFKKIVSPREGLTRTLLVLSVSLLGSLQIWNRYFGF